MTNIWRDRYLRTRYMVQRTIHEYAEKPTLAAYIEIFLTLFAISLFGVFAIRPTVITIGKLVQEIKAKQTTLETMNQKISDLNSAKDIYNKEITKINLVGEAIPVYPKPEILSLQIEQLAEENNTFINNLSVENTTILGDQPDTSDQILNFSLNVSGSYTDLVKFAFNIENLRRPIRYDGLSMTTGSTRNGNVLYMTLKNLSTPYFLK